MILQGQPNRVVQKMKKKNGRKKIVPIFRFDDNGLYHVPEGKYSKVELNRLKSLFKVLEDDYSVLEYKQLQVIYSEKTGKSSVGKKREDMIQELEEL